MPEILRSIATLLRKPVADRRQAPRFKSKRQARLLLNISLADGSQNVLPHDGYTRDLSEIGLSIIVPSLRVGDRYINSKDCELRIILLELPTGPIEIYTTPVRYVALDKTGTETGHLISVQITKMSDVDRARYLTYLQSIN